MFLPRAFLICICLTSVIFKPAEGSIGRFVAKAGRAIFNFFKGVHHAIHHGGHVLQFMGDDNNKRELDEKLDSDDEDVIKRLIDDEIVGVMADLAKSEIQQEEEEAKVEPNVRSMEVRDSMRLQSEPEPERLPETDS